MITTYQVSRESLNTMEQNSEAHTDKLISSVHSIQIHTSLEVQTLIRTSLFVSRVVYKEIVYK